MWLFYLRFDDRGHVQTYHIRTYNNATAAELITKAEHHGLMSTAKLVEYAAFIVSGTIKLKPMIVPNFHFYLHEEFIERWTAANVQVGTT